MRTNESNLIWEQYQHHHTPNVQNVILESIETVLKLPRTSTNSNILVNEADIVDVLRKLKAAGLGRVKKGETDLATGRQYTDADVAKDEEETAHHMQSLDASGVDYEPHPDLAHLKSGNDEADIEADHVPKKKKKFKNKKVKKLPKTADGKIDIVDALEAILKTIKSGG